MSIKLYLVDNQLSSGVLVVGLLIVSEMPDRQRRDSTNQIYPYLSCRDEKNLNQHLNMAS